MIEEWKEVEGYPLYKVSNKGNVKRVAHFKTIIRKDSGEYTAYHKERTLKNSLTNEGYCCVKLYNDVGHQSKMVHRLVGEAFIPNPEDKPTINHISGVKDDNSVSNLEWSTGLEQSLHANLYDLVSVHLRMRAVLVYDVDGHFLYEFDSQKAAERVLDIPQTRISERCRGVQKNPYKGYHFEYSNKS